MPKHELFAVVSHFVHGSRAECKCGWKSEYVGTGDLIADRRAIVLEPNFGAGEYRVYIGLYSGSRRMPVERGSASDDRLEAGTLLVE